MSRVYLTASMRKEAAVRRAEALENALIDRYVERKPATSPWRPPIAAVRERASTAAFWDLAPIEDLEVLADAWEEADFHGWADNIRAAIARRTGVKRDKQRARSGAVEPQIRWRRSSPHATMAYLDRLQKRGYRIVGPAARSQALSHRGPNGPRYFVYVIELRKPLLRRTRASSRPSVYVGSSALPPAARFKHHKTGALGTSRHVRRHGVRLLPRFYESYNPLRSRQEAQDAEKAIRAQLEAKGFRVYGSCHPRRNGCIL